MDSGSFSWRSSQTFTRCGEILITRPAEEIPEQLYLLGSATENQGTAPVPFRKESDGIFVIYTKLSSGNIYFTDALEDGVNYTVDSSGKLIEGDEAYNVEAEENVVRLTLNFNAKTISKDLISGVRMIWGATFDVIADMQYVGNGSFKKENVNIKFVDPNDLLQILLLGLHGLKNVTILYQQ